MMELQNKMNSISFHLLILLLFALFITGCCFFAGHNIISYLIDTRIYTEEYEEKRDERYIRSLQDYIDQNQIEIKDCSALIKWIKKQKVINLSVYQDNKKVFDSNYPNHDFWLEEVEEEEFEWVTYYRIRFADETARIGISGTYEYQLYNYVLFFEILFSFLLFLGIVLAGIRKKIEYIKLLRSEIEIIENGGLEYEISIRGNDELALMATGLNKMRISFIDMMEREKAIIEENQKTVTEMSHDLRTPVTSMLLFLEVMKKDDYQDAVLVKEYAIKLEQKVLHMKNLTDHLFKYSLVSRKDDADIRIMSFEESFYDQLSELCAYLMKNLLSISMKVEWFQYPIRISMEYQERILNNIASNILKYADRAYPVEISTVLSGDFLSLVFCNSAKKSEENEESYGVGLKSIENMMHTLDGECRHTVRDGMFCVALFFRIERQG